jgi:UDP:flavonoid glycosyltransferase YjiC (YdhE family)
VSRVFFCWELGGGTGHLHNLAPVAKALRRQGHEVTVAVRDLATASRFGGLEGFGLLQAPVLLRDSRLPPSVNYAELLFRVGYLDVEVLSGLIGAWRRLIRLVDPAFILVNHSPTALLAACLENVRSASVGSGFMIPPRTTPMPTIQPWRAVSEARLVRSEHQALARVNAAMARHRGRPFAALFDMLDVQCQFLTTLAEFDHYGPRADERYWGPIDVSVTNKSIEWPAGDGPRVFVYYRSGYPHFAEMMNQLAGLAWPTVVVADDASAAHVTKFSTENVRITTEQIDLRSVSASAAVAVCHGGHGSVMSLVLGGCPVVSLPVVVEQAQCAFRASEAGVGLTAGVTDGKPDIAGSVRRIVEEPAFAIRARAVGQRYRDLDPAEQVERIARRCEEIFLQA